MRIGSDFNLNKWVDYQNQNNEKEDLYDLDVEVKDLPPDGQLGNQQSNVVGCEITPACNNTQACSDACCRSVCSSC